MRSIARSRGAAGALTVVLLAALACSKPEAPAPAGRQKQVADPEEISRFAREIVVMVEGSKDRCLRVARETRRRYEANKNSRGFEPIHEFLQHHAKPEEAAIAAGSDIASQRLNDLYRLKTPEAKEVADRLQELLRAQRRLCQQTYIATGFGPDYDRRISIAMIDLVKNEQAVARHVTVTDAERREIRETYRPRIAEARQAVVDEFTALGQAAEWKYDPDEPDLGPEQAREREESWRRQQAWLEEQRRQQGVLHREAVEQWRGREPRAAEPKGRLGLVPSKEVSPEGGPRQSAMKTWHAEYTERALPAKIALDRVLLVREDVTAPRAARACQSLFGKASDLLVNTKTFDTPEPEVGRFLREAFTRFQGAAEACVKGEQAETERLLQEGQAALDRAAAILRTYSLAP